jgi:alpha-mannosidase
MGLTPEWHTRVKQWIDTLKRQVYLPLERIDLEYAGTIEHLRPDQAESLAFEKIEPGSRWGKPWQYTWFRASIIVPKEAAGKRLVVDLRTGGDSLIFVDGIARDTVSQNRSNHLFTIQRTARAGSTHRLLVEAYRGHVTVPCGNGPIPPGEQVGETDEAFYYTLGTTTMGIWEEELYQLWIEATTLFELQARLDPHSLRALDIGEGLRDFTLLLDMEAPRQEMIEQASRARTRLRPLLECVNGSTVPTMYAFGHGHLDVAWLWPLAETKRKIARTLAAQLSLADEYHEHRFLQSQPQLYAYVQLQYPELYARLKKAVKRGTVIAEGATWVEPDTNIPSGESLIRQFMHGKRFFEEEFGVDCRLLWLPDAFGYSANLPQIMKGCGVDYFATAKLMWRYDGSAGFPRTTFWWEGIDGSRVAAQVTSDYTMELRPGCVIDSWKETVDKHGLRGKLLPFGWGDGGGGPTRDHLEYARREGNLEGVPAVRIASPVEYFDECVTESFPRQRYVGELYFLNHRGTYTSQAKLKRGNRKSEVALREAELWGVIAQQMFGVPFGYTVLDALWKKVLLNQFHDILPGSSITRVVREAESIHAVVLQTANALTRTALSVLVKDIPNALAVFNSLGFSRTVLVGLPESFYGARSESGPLPVQRVEDTLFAEVSLPPCGWITLYDGEAVEADTVCRASTAGMENDLLVIDLDDRGEITSIIDKHSGRQLVAGPCNRFALYKDVPNYYDAWDILSNYELQPVATEESAEITVIAEGPLACELEIRRPLHHSHVRQRLLLRRGSRRIDFVTTVDWQERHKLLKVCFPVAIHAQEAVHEIQMGHLKRPNHRSRPYDADRFEVCNHRWTALCEEKRGCAVMNDCKYGVNVLDNSINLTLLRSPLLPDPNADRGLQEFTYSFYAWEGAFAGSRVVHEAADLNHPVLTQTGDAGERSLFSVDCETVIIETVKPAEDGSGDIVVRLYESARTSTRCRLTTSLEVRSVVACDMLERESSGPLAMKDGSIDLEFRPFEIKTLRLICGK